MNYNTTLKRFFGSQYLYGGVRMTISVLLPALILFHYDLLNTMMALPLGALCVSLTDLPGPLHHRRNSMLASIAINAIVVLIAGVSRNHPWLIAIEIAFFGMFFSMMGVYGNRVSGIGLIGLLAFIFNIDGQLETHNIWKDALWFSLGGGLYVLLTVLLTSLRPYKPVQQLLGECIMETADYLSIKAAFYLP
ncbi:MAG TPA: FUSC family protein, partial [Chitinophagaceae bacterium]|nr:FUSC family protein [Chitinophagaceae bacterium]